MLLHQDSTGFTSGSDTLPLAGVGDDSNTSGRFHAIKRRCFAQVRGWESAVGGRPEC